MSRDLDYTNIKTLSHESREKLNEAKPSNLGEASQIPGVSKADLTALLVWLKIQDRKKVKKSTEKTKYNSTTGGHL